MGWGGRGGREDDKGRERNACAQVRKKEVVEERESKARLLVCVCSLSFCCSFLSLLCCSLSVPNSSRWLLCFGLLSPLAFLDLVAKIQGGGEEKGGRRGKAKLRGVVVVVVKQKEQGA